MEAKGNELTGRGVILSPVDSVGEVEVLIDAGADELYGGVIPDGWGSADVPVNRRSFSDAQFPDESSFADAVKIASRRSVPLHLTLNAPFYHPDLYPDLLALCSRARQWGVASFIVGDPGLILRLNRELPQASITLSTMAGAMNVEALGFFADMGVSRAVFARHLTLGEMETLARAFPSLYFEVFVLIGKCPNEEAYCTFQHTSVDKRWPCETHYTITLAASGRAAEARDPGVKGRLAWMEADRRMGCGLCAMARLKAISVNVFKLVGRGGPTAGKIANVRLARKYADNAALIDAKEDYRTRFGRECSPEVCYFPELFLS